MKYHLLCAVLIVTAVMLEFSGYANGVVISVRRCLLPVLPVNSSFGCVLVLQEVETCQGGILVTRPDRVAFVLHRQYV